MIIAVFIVLLLYISVLVILGIGYKRGNTEKVKESEPKHHFSIIVPFRNEAKNLPELLKSLSQIEYPHHFFEVIFINDESTDNSEKIIMDFRLKLNHRLLHNERKTNSPKKDAIQMGIDQSQFDWIVTTDADCVLPSKWLNKINDYIIHFKTDMLLGPVSYVNNDAQSISYFQLLENLSLQFVTRGAVGLKFPIMSNGANLIYKKSVFYELNGFEGNQNIASGDDVFLLEKFRKRNPKSIIFLNSQEAIVKTKPANSWTEVINQRVRWASKTKHQKNILVLFLGVIITTTNFLAPICLLAIIFSDKDKWFFIVFLIAKITSDLLVILTTSKFYNFNFNFLKFIPHNLLYSMIFTIIFFRSIKGNYNWKSRKFIVL